MLYVSFVKIVEIKALLFTSLCKSRARVIIHLKRDQKDIWYTIRSQLLYVSFVKIVEIKALLFTSLCKSRARVIIHLKRDQKDIWYTIFKRLSDWRNK